MLTVFRGEGPRGAADSIGVVVVILRSACKNTKMCVNKVVASMEDNTSIYIGR